MHYSRPGSVVILEPGEPHTGGPAGPAGFVLVRRHASPASAGARGELRGGPGGAGPVSARVMSALADQLTSPPSLAELAADAGLSRYQLLRSFRAEVGMPPYAWLAQYRVSQARALLDRGHDLAQAAMLAGFADQAHLTRWFRRVVGITPGAYRNSVQDSPRREGRC